MYVKPQLSTSGCPRGGDQAAEIHAFGDVEQYHHHHPYLGQYIQAKSDPISSRCSAAFHQQGISLMLLSLSYRHKFQPLKGGFQTSISNLSDIAQVHILTSTMATRLSPHLPLLARRSWAGRSSHTTPRLVNAARRSLKTLKPATLETSRPGHVA